MVGDFHGSSVMAGDPAMTEGRGRWRVHQNARPWAISWVNSRMPVPIADNGA